MMNESLKERESCSLVQCAWCGAKIRDDNHEDAQGVCLKCFYQILSNRLQAQKRVAPGEFVSDR
jgi:DNA-directed RNA polymerase subunit RPC12/RpoP